MYGIRADLCTVLLATIRLTHECLYIKNYIFGLLALWLATQCA